MFFNNFAQGKDPKDCPVGDEHTDSMDALTLPIPIILASLTSHSAEEVREAAKAMVSLIRKPVTLNQYVDLYTDMLVFVATGR